MAATQQTGVPAQSWAPGVTHRYLTKAAEITGNHALVVEVRSDGAGDAASKCTGCGREEPWYYASTVKRNAQAHAETCRAVPRPQEA